MIPAEEMEKAGLASDSGEPAPKPEALDDVEKANADLGGAAAMPAEVAAQMTERHARWVKADDFRQKRGFARKVACAIAGRQSGTGNGLPPKEIVKQAWALADEFAVYSEKKAAEAGVNADDY